MKLNIDLKNLKLTKTQQKLFVITFIVIAAFVIFIMFIFVPQKKRFGMLKDELSTAEKEIDEIKRSTGTGGNEPMAKALQALQEKLKFLNTKFPPKEELVLRELPNLASRFNVVIGTMQPQKKRVVAKIGDTDVTIKGHTVEELNIGIAASGRCRDLGEYLAALKTEFPAAVRINNLDLARGSVAEGRLNAAFNITVYLVSEGSSASAKDR